MQFGGELFAKEHTVSFVVLCGVVLVLAALFLGWIKLPEGFLLTSVQSGKFDRNLLDYDADFRSGVNTGLLNDREFTNIILASDRAGSPLEECTKQFDEYRPGVDRNLISQNVNSECLRAQADRSGQENWRMSSDKVMQQFANTGTVIPNTTNPMMDPAAIKVPIGGSGMVRK